MKLKLFPSSGSLAARMTSPSKARGQPLARYARELKPRETLPLVATETALEAPPDCRRTSRSLLRTETSPTAMAEVHVEAEAPAPRWRRWLLVCEVEAKDEGAKGEEERAGMGERARRARRRRTRGGGAAEARIVGEGGESEEENKRGD